MMLYMGIKGFLDDLPSIEIRRWEEEFYKYMEKNHPEIEEQIQNQKALDEELMQRLDQIAVLFKREVFSNNSALGSSPKGP